MYRSNSCLRLLLFLAAPLLAAAGGETPAANARGATGILARELRAHVEELAADSYEGRETLHPGCERAADYIAKRFASYGLATAPGQEGYLVPYPLYRTGFDPRESKLAVDAVDFQPGLDFAPFPFSAQGEARSEVVFAGYGIDAPELKHEDYAGLDVKQKIVLVLRHWPKEQDPENPYKSTTHGHFATKANVAHRMGASAMLLVTDPAGEHGPDDFRFAEQLFVEPPEGGVPGENGIIAIHISPRAAAAILAPSGRSLAELQKALDGGARPAELALEPVRATCAVRAQGSAAVRAENVIGCLPGSHPEKRNEWIVIGAHYDHVGAMASAPGSAKADTIFNGADDNASGTSGLLELAQAFSSLPMPPERSIAFVAFSGEEKGLLGSRALVKQDIIPAARTVFMLNLDMIGRNPEQPVELCGDAFASGLRAMIEEANRGLDVELNFVGRNYAANSDHDSYFREGIPFLFFFTGFHPDYHQVGDHSDKIAFDRMEKITRLGYGIVDRVANASIAPALIHHVAWLGAELSLRNQRAVFTSVEPAGIAASAGLSAGDELVSISGGAITADRELRQRIDAIVPGTEAQFVLQRGEQRREVTIRRKKTGFIGISSQPVPEEERAKLGLHDNEGVRVNQVVPDSPAARAGLRAGDVIIQVNGNPVLPATLVGVLQRIGAGEKVTISYARDGIRATLELTLGERRGQ